MKIIDNRPVRASRAPSQDPLAIAIQTMFQCPYAWNENETIHIKLSYWMGNWHGDVLKIEHA